MRERHRSPRDEMSGPKYGDSLAPPVRVNIASLSVEPLGIDATAKTPCHALPYVALARVVHRHDDVQETGTFTASKQSAP